MNNARAGVWIFAAFAGIVQAWGSRFYIEPDGVNYLDIADAYLRRDWHSAINGYWSPLYSWLLAGAKWLFHPSAYWESTVLHTVNFALYLLALLCFEFFFRRLIALLALHFPDAVGEQGTPAWAWWALGYAAFLLATLRLITLSNDMPDMALAGLLFLASGLLIEVALGRGSVLQHAMLGIALGLAYLTKSVMFPLGFVYLAASALARGWKKPDLGAVVALVTFAVVSSPFPVALSHEKGHPTFGDTGKDAYFAQVTQPDKSRLVHVLRHACENPVVYEYGAVPFAATFPPWYDPSYWNEGAVLRFHLQDQFHAITRAIAGYFRIASMEKEWIAGWLVLAILAADWKMFVKRWLAFWFVWLPAMVMLGVYALVLVEPRYVGAAMAIVWISLFVALPWQKINATPKVGVAVIVAIVVVTGIALLREQAGYVEACVRPPAHRQWIAAMELKRMDLRTGDHVAALGHTTVADYWAHLAGLRIVGDVPVNEVPSYWAASSEKRNDISLILGSLGSKAIVSSAAPIVADGWQALGESGYYVKMLQAPMPAGSAGLLKR